MSVSESVKTKLHIVYLHLFSLVSRQVQGSGTIDRRTTGTTGITEKRRPVRVWQGKNLIPEPESVYQRGQNDRFLNPSDKRGIHTF